MHTARVNTKKKEGVSKISAKLQGAKHYVFADYCGLTVGQITELRDKLRAVQTTFHVVKNAYAKIAFSQQEQQEVHDLLVGPTALVLVEDDAAPMLKEIFDFSGDTALEIKGGLVDGRLCLEPELKQISKLPTRPVLLAQLMGACNAPAQNCAGVLSGLIQKLMLTLEAVSEKQGNN